jgi:tetratricopeptide (TPR) repeat protein
VDRRLGEIKEGAGLEESRLNLELIEFLKRHSDKFFLVIIAGALLIMGQRYWHQIVIDAEDSAWTAYNEAQLVGAERLEELAMTKPGLLEGIAYSYEDRFGLRMSALLDAGDEYLEAVTFGVKPHVLAPLRQNPFGFGDIAEEDRLTEESRATTIGKAETAYNDVLEIAGDDDARLLYRLQAWYGLASCAEARKDLDAARSFYQQVIDNAGPFEGQVRLAEHRIETLDSVLTAPRVVEAPSEPELPTDLLMEEPAIEDDGTMGPPSEEPDAEDTSEDAGAGQDEGGADAPDEPPADPE